MDWTCEVLFKINIVIYFSYSNVLTIIVCDITWYNAQAYLYIKIGVCSFGCDHTIPSPNCEGPPFHFLVSLESLQQGGVHLCHFAIFRAMEQSYWI
jgi:hypothetical protein